MSSMPQYDPLSTEIISTFLAGMSEGLNKLSTALNCTTSAVTDAAMSEVYIGEDDRYRIYQVAAGNRLWLSDPAPVIKKNGSTITAGTAGFTIDYVGGAIIFESASRLTVSDTVTVSMTRIASKSTEIVDIKANVTALQTLAGNFKGYYATKADLDTAYPTGANGNYAIIGGTVDSIYIWDATTSAWADIYKAVDLSSYYTKTEANALLATKEGTITAHGADPADDAYYYGGRKTWIDLATKARSVVLTGIDVTTSAIVSATDTVLGALGKLQAQITGKPFISAEGDPTTSTVGTVGQRLVNISSGNVFRCTAVAGEVYTWVKQGSTSDLIDSNVTNAKLANMANNTIKGNVSGSDAAPADLTVAQVRGIITEGTSEVDAIADGDKFVIEDVSATAGVRTKHVLWSALKTALGLIFQSSNGWNPTNETWTYASASTITVPSGAASKYSIGDSIRWKQGGAYKYGVISAVADTLLTIIVNTDYTVANSAITDNYYTHSATAIGLPAYYNFTPSFSNLTAGSGSNIGRYRTDGRKIEVNISWTFGSGAAIGVDPRVNLPVVASSWFVYIGSVVYVDSSTGVIVFGNIRTDGYLKYFAVSGSVVAVGFPSSTAPFTWETNDTIALSIAYSF